MPEIFHSYFKSPGNRRRHRRASDSGPAAQPQPYLVPVSPMASRSTHSNGVSGSTSTRWVCPFTFSFNIRSSLSIATYLDYGRPARRNRNLSSGSVGASTAEFNGCGISKFDARASVRFHSPHRGQVPLWGGWHWHKAEGTEIGSWRPTFRELWVFSDVLGRRVAEESGSRTHQEPTGGPYRI